MPCQPAYSGELDKRFLTMGDECFGLFFSRLSSDGSHLPSFHPSVCISLLAADLTSQVVYAFLKARSFLKYPQSVCDNSM